MDWNRIEGNWKQVKGKVKEQWGKIGPIRACGRMGSATAHLLNNSPGRRMSVQVLTIQIRQCR